MTTLPYQADPEQTETRVLHALADLTGRDVLEVGCGNGRLTWRYADRAAPVLALDPKAEEVKAARTSTPVHLRSCVRFRTADITAAKLPEKAFDVAVLSWSI
jgi:ubiquinone/menaquinone biosynthesis C-methylase UbiE